MFHHLNLSIRFPGITKNYELYTFEWYEKRGSLQQLNTHAKVTVVGCDLLSTFAVA